MFPFSWFLLSILVVVVRFIISSICFFVFFCGLCMLISMSSAICCVFFIHELLFVLLIVLCMYTGLRSIRFIAYLVLFISILCSMSSILSSSYMDSLGVVCGILRVRFIILSRIVFNLFICVLFISHVSALYVIIGIMHVSSRVHIVYICIPLKLSSVAMYSIVCSAASVFCSIPFMWSSMLFFVFMVSPRYL